MRSRSNTPLKVLLAEEGVNDVGMSLKLMVPKAYLIAVGQENVRHVQHLGILQCLSSGLGWVYSVALSLDNSQCPPMPVVQHIVGS